MSKFTLTIFKSLKENILRLLSIVFIVFLTTSLGSGVGASGELILNSFSSYYESSEISDLIIKSKSESGFSSDEINELTSLSGVKDYYSFFSADMEIKNDIYRIYTLPSETMRFNKLELVEGTYPKKYNEVLVEEGSSNYLNYKVGEEIKVNDLEFNNNKINLTLKVVGKVINPLYVSKYEEYTWLDGEKSEDDRRTIKQIFYLNKSILDYASLLGINLPTTDIMLSLALPTSVDYFSSYYKDSVKKVTNFIKEKYGEDTYGLISLEENLSYKFIEAPSLKVNNIAIVLSIFFTSVCSLIVYITIKKLVEDERKVIACYESLGIINFKILLKYLIFGTFPTLIGGLIGYVVGACSLPFLIYNAFDTIAYLPPLIFTFEGLIGGVVLLIILLLSFILSFALTFKLIKKKPSELFLLPSPKAGKTILLEKIKPLWNLFPFRLKSSFRNIIRQKAHLILTSLSIIGISILVFLGFSLLDISEGLKDEKMYAGLADAILPICIILIVFSLLLAVLIIFSLVNMNISSRKRELATLMVLGYHDLECAMYIYRETIILTLFGIILGLPLGYLSIYLVTLYLDFGNMQDIKWLSFLYTFLVVFISSIIADFMLYKEIKGINMEGSLKSLE